MLNFVVYALVFGILVVLSYFEDRVASAIANSLEVFIFVSVVTLLRPHRVTVRVFGPDGSLLHEQVGQLNDQDSPRGFGRTTAGAFYKENGYGNPRELPFDTGKERVRSTFSLRKLQKVHLVEMHVTQFPNPDWNEKK